jgi:hypothetical protein
LDFRDGFYPSRRRKCTLPDALPATMVSSAGEGNGGDLLDALQYAVNQRIEGQNQYFLKYASEYLKENSDNLEAAIDYAKSRTVELAKDSSSGNQVVIDSRVKSMAAHQCSKLKDIYKKLNETLKSIFVDLADGTDLGRTFSGAKIAADSAPPNWKGELEGYLCNICS